MCCRRILNSIFLLSSTSISLHAATPTDQCLPPDYTPNYIGTLLQIPAHNQPPGSLLFEGYLSPYTVYGTYDNDFNLQRQPCTYFIGPTVYLETGITDWLDIVLLLDGSYIIQGNHHKWRMGDALVGFGVQLLSDQKGTAIPDLRLYIQQNVPLGQFDHLAPSTNIPATTGSGSWQTGAFLAIQKIFYLIPYHPFELNLNLGYTYSPATYIHGYSAYGFGEGALGQLKPGNIFFLNFSGEYSFTPKMAFAMDMTYAYTSEAHFMGNPGSPDSDFSKITLPSTVTFNLTPMFEYIIDDTSGILIGASFSVWGRNVNAYFSPTIYYSKIF